MNTISPRIGVLLPTRSLVMDETQPKNMNTTLAMAERIDKTGLDSVWVGDSVTSKPRPDPITVLAAIAARTKNVRLGTGVLLAALRNPILLAHAAATTDLIAEGRTVLGVGVGGAFNKEQRQEWLNVGVSPTERAQRLEEMIGIVKQLTNGNTVSHKGNHFNLESVRLEPKSPQVGGVPILVACHWNSGIEAQYKRAGALGDGFISISDTPEEYAKLLEKVHGYANDAGHDTNKMESAFYLTVNLNTNEKKANEEADRYLNLYYGMNIWGSRWGPYGAPERIVERMRQYYEAGANTLIVRFAAPDQQEQLDVFLSEVVPAV